MSLEPVRSLKQPNVHNVIVLFLLRSVRRENVRLKKHIFAESQYVSTYFDGKVESLLLEEEIVLVKLRMRNRLRNVSQSSNSRG